MTTLKAYFSATSEALFLALTKDQLSRVAEHYSIEVTLPRSANKQQLANFIHEQLIDRQVLSVEKPQGVSGSEDVLQEVTQVRSSELSFEQQIDLMKLQHELHLEREKMEMEKRILDAQEREKDRCLEVAKLRNLDQEREVERTRLTLAAEGKLGRPSTQTGLAGMVKFLPKFDEREPDVFFSLFEHVADDLNWGDEERTLLLQTVLVGRGQKAFVALPSAERKVYTCVKDAVLRSYELIPEAYRQRFRSWKKADRQTYGELARDLTSSFTRWLTAEGVGTFDA